MGEIQILRRVAFGAFLIALYLNAGITFDGRYFPGVVATATGLVLAALVIPSEGAVKKAVLLLAAVSAWTPTILLSPAPSYFLGEHLISLANLAASTVIAYAVFREAITIPAATMHRAATALTGILLIVAILEIYTPFRDLVDAFRVSFYEGGFIYQGVERDVRIAGKIRPTGFTQEPSHFAKGLSVALTAAILTSTSRLRYWYGGAVWLLAVFLAGSPTLLLAPAVIALVHIFKTRRNVTGMLLRAAIIFVPILSLALLEQIAAMLPFARAQAIAMGEDTSTITRSIGPVLIAWNVWLEYPIAGAGIGGRELVTDVVIDVYRQFPGYWIGRLTGANEGYAGWGNAFFEIPAYSGLVCGAFILPALYRSLKVFGGSSLLAFGMFFLVFNFDSGFVSQRPWGYFGLIIAVAAVSWRIVPTPVAVRARRSPRSSTTR